MIISASYRTDIPAFYGDWFSARLAAGAAVVPNPYGGKPSRLSLRPEDVTAFVFWTRNPTPFLPALDRVAALNIPFALTVTVLGYPRALDRSVPAPDAVLPALETIAGRFGPDRIVWRYDPIVLTPETDAAWHRAQLAALADRMAVLTDEVTVSFLAPYAKTKRNLARAVGAEGVGWHDPPTAEKIALLDDLSEIADRRGISLTLCTQPDLTGPGRPAAACIDIDRLSRIAGRPLAAKRKANRPGCLCAGSRDLGVYDTCPHGCAYCYAVTNRDRAVDRHRRHDPTGEGLG